MGFSGIPARIVADIGTTGGLALDTSVLGVEASVDLMSAKLPSALGRQAAGASLSTAMAMEDRTTFLAMLADLEKFTFIASRLQVDAVVSSDIEIGAVEIKNATTEDRVVVRTDGSEMAMVVTQNSQPLPTGAATAANQANGNTSLGSIDAKLNSLGQKSITGSVPVVIASDQTPVSISAMSLPLPTGAATSANQATANASLASIDGKIVTTANGIKVDGSAVTQPVSGTFFQATQPVSAVSLPLPTGAATSANQATASASLASIDGKLGTLGQKAMAGSAPVVLASDQSGIGPNTDLSVSGSIAALNGAVTLQVHGAASALVSLGGTWVATAQIQGQAPDGSWSNLTVALVPSGTTFSSAPVSANGNYRIVTASGYTALRVTATAFTSGSISVNIVASSAPTIVAPVQLNAANLQVTNTPVDGARTTYSASISGLASALLATDIFTITGSASKTVRVTKIEVSGIAGSNGNATFVLAKRSTANTGGTSAAQTAVPHDSAAAAATATVLAYTANPTTGNLVGNIASSRVSLAATNAAAGVMIAPMLYSDRPAQAVVLRGIAEVLAVNLAGATIAGSSLNISIEWTEE